MLRHPFFYARLIAAKPAFRFDAAGGGVAPRASHYFPLEMYEGASMFLFTAALALAAAPQAGAATPPSNAQARPVAAGEASALVGVVTDGTITAAGQEFYRHFCAYWHDKPLNDMVAIAVRERLSARRGNQIVVEYAGRVLFHGVLPPARGQIRPLSQQAVEISYETAVNAEVQRLLFSDDELAPDEF